MKDEPSRSLRENSDGPTEAVSTHQMREIEERGVSIGISKLMMMENAGSSTAREVFELSTSFSSINKRSKVALLAGTGNNGGDAFVSARHLAYWHELFEIEVILVGSENEIKAEEARTNWNILQSISGVRIQQVDSSEKLAIVREAISRSDFLVVGIFGTGFRGEPRELQKLVIREINKRGESKKVISVDIPSGMEADTGRAENAVRTDVTVTMHAVKKGMVSNELAKMICGRIVVANIGLPS